METVTTPEVRKPGGLIGAEVRGLHLTREYSDETCQAPLRAWAEHGVIFFRDQHLTARQEDALASWLGEIRVRPELRKEPEQTKAVGDGWHFAVNDYQGQRRLMHRILLAGSAPVAAA